MVINFVNKKYYIIVVLYIVIRALTRSILNITQSVIDSIFYLGVSKLIYSILALLLLVLGGKKWLKEKSIYVFIVLLCILLVFLYDLNFIRVMFDELIKL